MTNIDLQFEKILDESGIRMELDIVELLENNGWICFHSRYYIDDLTNKPREIDILALKGTSVRVLNRNITVITALIISCKKSKKKSWVYIVDKTTDTNLIRNTFGMKTYTNSKFATYFEKLLLQGDHDYQIRRNDLLGIKSNYIFRAAFEVNNESNGNISRNSSSKDQGLYSSIEQLIKATSYEMAQINQRNLEDNFVFYDYNMISILDGKMWGYIGSEKKGTNRLNNIYNYRNTHIVDSKPRNISIHFTTYDFFSKNLKKFEDVHDKTVELFNKFKDDFLKQYFNNDYFTEYYTTELSEVLISKKFKDRLERDFISFSKLFLTIDSVELLYYNNIDGFHYDIKLSNKPRLKVSVYNDLGEIKEIKELFEKFTRDSVIGYEDINYATSYSIDEMSVDLIE